jgi:16S rRNA (cytidine1402-2'-O)-methyltransferase
MSAPRPFGTLFLLPTPLGPDGAAALTEGLVRTMTGLNYLIVEQAKTARRLLRTLGYTGSLDAIEMVELNEHTPASEVRAMLNPMLEGRDGGLMSEAGLPCIADPGHQVVRLAHQLGISVKPLTGPSSIFLALMASGMNGQSFTFHGYLPQGNPNLGAKLKVLEQNAIKTGQTQIWIETPYRNKSMLDNALSQLANSTRLAVAADLSLPTEYICSQHIAQWKKQTQPDLHKRPAVWLLGVD